MPILSKIFGLSTSALLLFSISCSKNNTEKPHNKVHLGEDVEKIISDEEISLKVYSQDVLRKKIAKQEIIPTTNKKFEKIFNKLPQVSSAQYEQSSSQEILENHNQSLTSPWPSNQENSLSVGYPIDLLGDESVWGAVITKVSEKESSFWGALKLTDLPPIHVRSFVTTDESGQYFLILIGCVKECSENSQQYSLVGIPIQGYEQETRLIILDLASLGKKLDLMALLDPQGEATKHRSLLSKTTFIDYDMKTLVFDIETKMIPMPKPLEINDSGVKSNLIDIVRSRFNLVSITSRWYIKLSSQFNSGFESRPETKGVGYFKTYRSKNNKIIRFPTTSFTGLEPIKYFIKDVPETYKKSFSKAIDSWNKEFESLMGRKIIAYEFVDKNHPSYNDLIIGDVRYNIIQWDLTNKAPYGGLGPAIANQFSGEIFSANVLIQGPSIIEIYTKWFETSKKIKQLQEQGLLAKAESLHKNFEAEQWQLLKKSFSKNSQKLPLQLKMGPLNFNVHSFNTRLSDSPLKEDFEIVPDGVTFESYMDGYFQEMVAHEIGHNLGLRHNFKGNLGAIDHSTEFGTASRSIMEYLGRSHRYLNSISVYDRMAIAYGYMGEVPTQLNWFCTDEDVADLTKGLSMLIKSAECSKADATSDPFHFFENQFERIISLLVASNHNLSPAWDVETLKEGKINPILQGLFSYASSASLTSETWTNFFGKYDRPFKEKDVKPYVLEKMKNILCHEKWDNVLKAKTSQEAFNKAQENLNQFKELIVQSSEKISLFTKDELSCEEDK